MFVPSDDLVREGIRRDDSPISSPVPVRPVPSRRPARLIRPNPEPSELFVLLGVALVRRFPMLASIGGVLSSPRRLPLPSIPFRLLPLPSIAEESFMKASFSTVWDRLNPGKALSTSFLVASPPLVLRLGRRSRRLGGCSTTLATAVRRRAVGLDNLDASILLLLLLLLLLVVDLE